MTHDKAVNFLTCKLMQQTVAYFVLCCITANVLTQQTAFTMTNILNSCYIVSWYSNITDLSLLHSTLYVSAKWR
jgi:hypothetical protein